MDDRTVLPSWQGLSGGGGGEGGIDDAPVVEHRYRLGLETAVSVRSIGNAWWCTPERSAGGNVAAEEWRAAGEGDGAAQALVDLLRYAELPSVPGFRVVRLAPPPEAIGERLVDPDTADGAAHSTMVVGERVVVAWTRRTTDTPHPGARILQHLAALEFMGVPELYGLLMWRTPGGHELPVAVASRYLPRSRNGWAWAAELVDAAAGLVTAPAPVGTPPAGIDLSAVELPARLGRLVAKLHLALATPSSVDLTPAAEADAGSVRRWHQQARAELDAALGAENELRPLVANVDRLGRLADEVAAGARRVVVQRVHGDLNVGRVLRWTRGLAVVGFDAAPPEHPPEEGNALRPAALDVARLLASLSEVARRAGRRPGMPAEAPWAWYREARQQVLWAYRTALAAEERSDLLDDDLLVAFEAAEHARSALRRTAQASAAAGAAPLH
jgi:maltokinase